MKRLLKILVLALLLSASAFRSVFASDILEIEIQLHTTHQSRTRTNEHEQTVICVLGTNDWYISGQFLRNARVQFWLTGTTVVERKVINKGMYWEQAKEFISEKMGTRTGPSTMGTYPEPGETWMQTNSWLNAFGYGTERAVWLAFCSGRFLRQPDRQVPLPLGHFSDAQGYVDKTVLLPDRMDVSPPKTLSLFTTNGTLVCSYEALALTNVLGRALPLTFRLTQYGSFHHQVDTNASRTVLIGEVRSIKNGQIPRIPDLKATRKE